MPPPLEEDDIHDVPRVALIDVTGPEHHYKISSKMRYSEMENEAYAACGRSRDQWSVHFHEAKADFAETPCKWILRATQWKYENYIAPQRSGSVETLIYAHSIPVTYQTPVVQDPITATRVGHLTCVRVDQSRATRETSTAESIDVLHPDHPAGQTNVGQSVQSVVRKNRRIHQFTPEDDKYIFESRIMLKRTFKQIKNGNPRRPEWRDWSTETIYNYWHRQLMKSEEWKAKVQQSTNSS